MNIVNRPNNVFALMALFIFIAICGISCSPDTRKSQSASIAAIEAEYYTHGNFDKTYQIASAAAFSYHQKNAIKQEAEALVWMAEMKFVQGDYTLSAAYLSRAQPIIGKLRNDSLAVGSYLLRGELFTARILPDSAKWCFCNSIFIVYTIQFLFDGSNLHQPGYFSLCF
ncbi:MAG: hypothetical protein JWP37_3173 [Mucilaginibacter sp.]|nr:hypothetical protein [Mucilaginibacter sp.]